MRAVHAAGRLIRCPTELVVVFPRPQLCATSCAHFGAECGQVYVANGWCLLPLLVLCLLSVPDAVCVLLSVLPARLRCMPIAPAAALSVYLRKVLRCCS